MRTRSLLFGLVLLTACSQKFESPLATTCNDGIAVSSGSAWQCQPAGQLAIGTATTADHAQSAANATQALSGTSAASARVADGFSSDALIALDGAQRTPGVPIDTNAKGIELESHSVVTGLQQFTENPGFDETSGSGTGGAIVLLPTDLTAHLRIRVSGQLVALNQPTTCRVILYTGPSSFQLAETEVSSAGEPRTWFLESELDLPASDPYIGLEMLNEASSGTSECFENPAVNSSTTAVSVHVEVMNHGE